MRSKYLMTYVALAYFISWLVFILLALNHHQIIFIFKDDADHPRLQDVLHAFGGLGPLLAAIITLRIHYNKTERRQFLKGYSARRLTGKGWILSLSPLVIFGVSLLISKAIRQEWADIAGFFKTNDLNEPLNLIAWFLPLLFYGFGEEGGWRGFALPVLQSRHSAFTATIILSLIWAGWHIPSFFYRYNLKGVAYAGFLFGLFAGAVWLTFLFNYTKGSILAVSIWHLTFNLVSMIGKDDELLSGLMSGIIMTLAVFVLIRFRTEHLAPFKRTSLIGKIPEAVPG